MRNIVPLLTTDANYPMLLSSQLGSESPNIYVDGDQTLLSKKYKRVAIVSSSRLSPLGANVTKEAVKRYTDNGFVVVGCMSCASDSIAISTACDMGVKSVLILPRSFNWSHHMKNSELIDRVLSVGGLVVTVFEPGKLTYTAGTQHIFDLYAALADEVFVAESNWRNGSYLALPTMRLLHKPIVAAKYNSYNANNIYNYYLRMRTLIEQRIEEIKKGINNQTHRIIVLSRRSGISYKIIMTDINRVDGYEVMPLFFLSTIYDNIYDIAQNIIDYQPSAIAVDPNDENTQELLIKMWDKIPQTRNLSYLFPCVIHDSAISQIISGDNKYQHRPGTNIIDVVNAAVNQLDNSNYIPTIKQKTFDMDTKDTFDIDVNEHVDEVDTTQANDEQDKKDKKEKKKPSFMKNMRIDWIVDD